MSRDVGPASGALRIGALMLVSLPVLYVLSSGPVIALGCWLRETTHWDGFYGVLWIYYPLVVTFGPDSLLGHYIEWWVVDVFHTVGPG